MFTQDTALGMNSKILLKTYIHCKEQIKWNFNEFYTYGGFKKKNSYGENQCRYWKTGGTITSWNNSESTVKIRSF
jgi:hypothetical protein